MADENEIKTLWWDDGSLVCWAPEYAKRELPNDASTKSVMLGVLRCQETGAIPETADIPNLTGRYSASASVCCVNHAGQHLQLWYSSTKGERHVYRYWADYLEETGVFEIREEGDPTVFFDVELAPGAERSKPVGHLAPIGPGKFRIDWAEGSSGKYERFSDRATLPQRVIDALRGANYGDVDPVLRGWLDDEHAPLRQPAVDAVAELLKSDAFRSLLQDLFGLEVDSGNLNRDKVQIAIKKILDALGPSIAVFASADQERVASRMMPLLVSFSVRLKGPDGGDETRSLFQWFQRVLYYQDNFTLGKPDADLQLIPQWLGVPRSAQYVYHVKAVFTVLGLEESLPFSKALSGLAPKGRMVLKKSLARAQEAIEKFHWGWGKAIPRKKVEEWISKKVGKKIDKLLTQHAGAKVLWGVVTVRSPDDTWEATYDCYAVVGAAGTGGAKNIEFKPLRAAGYAVSDVEINPTHFTGNFDMLTGLMADAGQNQLKGVPMTWIVDGGGTGGKIRIIFDDVDTKASDMDIGWGTGVISDIESDDVKRFARRKVAVGPSFDYTEKYRQEENIYFQLGSATVRPIGRQILRIFAANELALLRDGMSALAIEGYADRVGQRWYNKTLSESRATNTRQALVDCLGDDLQASVMTNGYGEDVLQALDEMFDFPDSKPSEQWRRVFVVLNANVAATMGTNDNKLSDRTKQLRTKPKKA